MENLFEKFATDPDPGNRRIRGRDHRPAELSDVEKLTFAERLKLSRALTESIPFSFNRAVR